MRGRMQVLTRTVTVITKPQHISNWDVSNVVSHPYSSPNHNWPRHTDYPSQVVSHPYSSPNHNFAPIASHATWLYLILIHHQTTTIHHIYSQSLGCISSSFITKPQLCADCVKTNIVVYHLHSSPNHNGFSMYPLLMEVVYHLHSSPNHNICGLTPEDY